MAANFSMLITIKTVILLVCYTTPFSLNFWGIFRYRISIFTIHFWFNTQNTHIVHIVISTRFKKWCILVEVSFFTRDNSNHNILPLALFGHIYRVYNWICLFRIERQTWLPQRPFVFVFHILIAGLFIW